MKILIGAQALSAGMTLVSRALSARPARQAYEGVLLETADDGLYLTCTDGEMTIRTRVDASIARDGCALLPAKLLSDLTRRLPEGEIELSVDDRSRARVKGAGTNTSMMTLPAEDFPEIGDEAGAYDTRLTSNKTRSALSRVLFALSDDETRKILTGCLMETYRDETRFVTLDGFRLALQRVYALHDIEAGEECRSAVIPGRVVSELSRILPDDETPVHFYCGQGRVTVAFGDTRVYSPLLAGEYINYKQILPATWHTMLKIKVAEMGSAVERAALMAREGKNNLLRFHLEPDRVTITANAELGDCEEELPVEFDGSMLDIAFNSKYLTDVIRNIDDEELCMRFNTNVSPCVVCPVEGDQFNYLVLPVRVYGA